MTAPWKRPKYGDPLVDGVLDALDREKRMKDRIDQLSEEQRKLQFWALLQFFDAFSKEHTPETGYTTEHSGSMKSGFYAKTITSAFNDCVRLVGRRDGH